MPFERRNHGVGLEALAAYEDHLAATWGWLLASFERGHGAARGAWSIPFGWSRPCVATTGSALPTLLALGARFPARGAGDVARRAGEWLISIQAANGSFDVGPRAPRRAASEGWATAHALRGLVALARARGDERGLDAASHGARWLAARVHAGELGHDVNGGVEPPTGRAHVAWSLLEAWTETRDGYVLDAAVSLLSGVLDGRGSTGVVPHIEARLGEPTRTDAIALAIRGCIESARILDDWARFGAPVVPDLRRLLEASEYSGGALAGAFECDGSSAADFTCLAANSGTAVDLLLWEQRTNDPRVVHAAAKLVETVCAAVRPFHPWRGVRGGVPGASPPWASPARFRYPGWAAKNQCDALALLTDRLEREAGLGARLHRMPSLVADGGADAATKPGSAARAS